MLLSSHILTEVEALCDRVSIVRARAHRGVRHAGPAASPDPHLDHRRARPAPTGLGRCPACTTCESTARTVRLDVDTDQLGCSCSRQLGAHGVGCCAASRRRWRSCSCATTPSRRRAHDRLHAGGDRVAGPVGAAPGPGDPADLDRVLALSASTYARTTPVPLGRRPGGAGGSLATSPALKVLYGPAYDLTTAGGFVAWRIGGFLALLTGSWRCSRSCATPAPRRTPAAPSW